MMKQDKFIWLRFKAKDLIKLKKDSKVRKVVEENNENIFEVRT